MPVCVAISETPDGQLFAEAEKMFERRRKMYVTHYELDWLHYAIVHPRVFRNIMAASLT